MFGSGTLISGAGIATGFIVLAVLAAWAAMTVLTVFAVRRSGVSGMAGALWGGGLVLACILLAASVFERVLTRDVAAERRAIDARAAELAARAIAPGSALTCLDAVSMPVETACEKALFATPEAVAAAVAYVEARYSLFVASAALAARDPGYQPAVERLRRGLEEDRFGLVAQLFSMRGCNPTACADLAVLRDARRIVANMKGNVFAAHVAAHGLAWNPAGSSSAIAAGSLLPSPATAAPSSGMPPSPLGSTTRSRLRHRAGRCGRVTNTRRPIRFRRSASWIPRSTRRLPKPKLRRRSVRRRARRLRAIGRPWRRRCLHRQPRARRPDRAEE